MFGGRKSSSRPVPTHHLQSQPTTSRYIHISTNLHSLATPQHQNSSRRRRSATAKRAPRWKCRFSRSRVSRYGSVRRCPLPSWKHFYPYFHIRSLLPPRCVSRKYTWFDLLRMQLLRRNGLETSDDGTASTGVRRMVFANGICALDSSACDRLGAEAVLDFALCILCYDTSGTGSCPHGGCGENGRPMTARIGITCSY